MQRISRALARYAPPTITIVDNPDDADLHILYVIAPDALQVGRDLIAANRQYAAIQCCWNCLGVADDDWAPFWRGSLLTWSYYDMSSQAAHYGFNFYHAPLGLDDAFIQPFDFSVPREPLVVTTGYSQHGEAISEVWKACSLVGLRCFHVGPNRVEGMTMPENWTAKEGVTDEELASLYRRATWISGLRHSEGFELPCAESVACGAIPLVFDQPSMRTWYRRLTPFFISECHGDDLVDCLVRGPFNPDNPVWNWQLAHEHTMKTARERFNWEAICAGFWDRLLGKETK